MGRIFIKTGDIRTGKTTYLMNTFGKQPAAKGILTPVIGEKRQFYDIGGQEMFAMEWDSEDFADRLEVGRFVFSKKAFEKADSIIRSASKDPATRTLIIDEIGPLELNEKGFHGTLNHVLCSDFGFDLVLVVRSTLVDKVADKFGIAFIPLPEI